MYSMCSNACLPNRSFWSWQCEHQKAPYMRACWASRCAARRSAYSPESVVIAGGTLAAREDSSSILLDAADATTENLESSAGSVEKKTAAATSPAAALALIAVRQGFAVGSASPGSLECSERTSATDAQSKEKERNAENAQNWHTACRTLSITATLYTENTLIAEVMASSGSRVSSSRRRLDGLDGAARAGYAFTYAHTQ
mmetsp:Transcript_7937/g.21034  ORF Transcript_7937/g.21034 Transcript_7937/m.21034 type:complete len:200 (-) Transcript_7937:386-985(-)